MKIERDGENVATVKKALVTPLRDRFSVDVQGGDDMEAKGNIVDHEYKIERGDSRWRKCRSAGSGYATPTESTLLPVKTTALLLAVIVCIEPEWHTTLPDRTYMPGD